MFTAAASSPPPAPLARALMGDMARYAGRKGAVTGLWVVLAAVLDGIGLALIVPVVNLVFGSGGGFLAQASAAFFRFFGAATPFARLALLSLVMAVLILLRTWVSRLRAVGVAEIQSGFVEHLRLAAATALAHAPWPRIAALQHARITHVMSGDIQRVGAAGWFVLQAVTALALLLAQGVLALILSPLLAALAFAVMAAMTLALYPVLQRARGLGAEMTAGNLVLLHQTTQFLGGLKLAIGQDLQERFLAGFAADLSALTRRQIEFTRQQSLVQSGGGALPALFALVLILAGYGLFHLQPAVLLALIAVIARMAGPLQTLQQGAQQIAAALPAYGAVTELIAGLGGATSSPPQDAPPIPIQGSIGVEEVSYRHEPGGRGLEALSFTLAPGEFVGLCGPSGTGKTTLADLLTGLYPPQTGRILIDGRPLDVRLLPHWRRALSYVSQDSFLLHTSVRSNLLWSCGAATEGDILAALDLVGAAALVRAMPEGLETVVGERGMLVSGGERQRLALAGALLRKPRLLILDEATGALDIESEAEILARLRALSPRPAILLIAHRRESLRFCDRILALG